MLEKYLFENKSKFSLLYMSFIGTLILLDEKNREKNSYMTDEKLLVALANEFDTMYLELKDELFDKLIENLKRTPKNKEKSIDIYSTIMSSHLQEIKKQREEIKNEKN